MASFNANYTWGHVIDAGSTWHSGATSSNSAGAGEGYTTDVTLLSLIEGTQSSTSGSACGELRWELPFFQSQKGFIGHAGRLAV